MIFVSSFYNHSKPVNLLIVLCAFCELRLVVTLQHVPIGVISDGIDVGRNLMTLLPLVHLNDLLRVDGQKLIGVHHHTEEA